jgi:hypothetical protein
LRAPIVAIVCVLVACSKTHSSSDPRGARKEISFWLDPRGAVPPDDVAVSTTEPPSAFQLLERGEFKIAVVGVGAEGDATPLLQKAMDETFRAGSNATVVVTTRCLKDLVPGMQQDLLYFWHMVAAVGAHCEGTVPARIGAAVFVEVGSASRIQVTFDRRTRAFLKVEPLR